MKPCASRTHWLGRRVGAQDIAQIPRTRKGAQAVGTPSEAQRNDWDDFAEFRAMLNRAARSIYPAVAVPLRGTLPTAGTARRQATQERATLARLDPQPDHCPIGGRMDNTVLRLLIVAL